MSGTSSPRPGTVALFPLLTAQMVGIGCLLAGEILVMIDPAVAPDYLGNDLLRAGLLAFAILAPLVFPRAFPRLTTTGLTAFPFLAATAFLLTRALHPAIGWWILLQTALAAWILWEIQVQAIFRWDSLAIPLLMADFLSLVGLYVDRVFFLVTRSHLTFQHLFLVGRDNNWGDMGSTRGLVWEAISYTTLAAGLLIAESRFWSHSHPLRKRRIRWLFPAALLLASRFFTFDAFLEDSLHSNPATSGPLFAEYLTLRYSLPTWVVPPTRRFSHPLMQKAVMGKQAVQPDRIRRQATFFRTDPTRSPHLVIIRVESWRGDAVVESMPRLRRRITKGLWLRRHFSQINSTTPSTFSIFTGAFPFRFSERSFIASASWIEFLHREGWEPESVNVHFDALPLGFGRIPIPEADQKWRISADALPKVLDRLSQPGRHLIDTYLPHPHFPYYYPPEYERHRPVIAEAAIDQHILDRPPPEVIEGLRNRFRNSIHYLDDLLERFFEGLAARGLASRTLVVLLGDHGQAFGEHGTMTHCNSPILVQFHTPCLILGPGVEARTSDRLSQHIDLVHLLGGPLGYRTIGGAGGNPLQEERDTLLLMDGSVPDRFVLHRWGKRMTLFDITPDNHLRWVLTTDADFELTPEVLRLYDPDSIASLASIIDADRQEAERQLGKNLPRD